MARPTKKPRPAARAKMTRPPAGRHLIDLTDHHEASRRLAEYQAAFGLPSSLHEPAPPVPVQAHGLARLKAVFQRSEA